jgi:hypothetical protein
MPRRDFESRTFLNGRLDRTAFVATHVRAAGKGSVDAGVVIGDCQRTLTLDFDLYSADRADAEAMLEKLETLQKSIGDFARQYRLHIRQAGLLDGGD